MTTYREAAKELKRVGCGPATGDALRAMYARMIPWHCCLQSKPDGNPTMLRLYAHLQTMPDDKAVESEARRLLREPLAACEVVFSDLAETVP